MPAIADKLDPYLAPLDRLVRGDKKAQIEVIRQHILINVAFNECVYLFAHPELCDQILFAVQEKWFAAGKAKGACR